MTGWHVPTDSEWSILTTYLGGTSVAGGMMKETGATHWLSPNTGATNSSGFSALPGGCRYTSGKFVAIGDTSYWWSSTASNIPNSNSWSRTVGFNDAGVSRPNDDWNNGFSVRCVRYH